MEEREKIRGGSARQHHSPLEGSNMQSRCCTLESRELRDRVDEGDERGEFNP